MTVEEFDRQKIYEKLKYLPEPEGYKEVVPWVIQQQIAATNGIHYVDSIGKLKEFPIPPSPLPAPNAEQSLCLDIGCGWGRWLVAFGRQGYLPIGVDLRQEFCASARETLRCNNLSGYTVVADLKNLPFKDGIFSAVWSFSVIQHTHQDRLKDCIQHIHRILINTGFCFLEFPNKYGIHNFFGPVKKAMKRALDYNSWVVRYYSIKEYRSFFTPVFDDFRFIVHSMLGIGVLPNDLKYAKGLKNRVLIALSLILTRIAKLIKPLAFLADSIYIICHKNQEWMSDESQKAIRAFLVAHQEDPNNNLNLVHLLICPVTGGTLRLDGENLISDLGQIAYPIIDGIPIVVVSEGRNIR